VYLVLAWNDQSKMLLLWLSWKNKVWAHVQGIENQVEPYNGSHWHANLVMVQLDIILHIEMIHGISFTILSGHENSPLANKLQQVNNFVQKAIKSRSRVPNMFCMFLCVTDRNLHIKLWNPILGTIFSVLIFLVLEQLNL
jgi:hypothetical protein